MADTKAKKDAPAETASGYQSNQVHPAQAGEESSNRRMEADNVASVAAREAKFAKAEADRQPDYNDPDQTRAVEAGAFAGQKIVADTELRDTEGAAFVSPRHSASGKWEGDAVQGRAVRGVSQGIGNKKGV